ncbi:acetyl-CoA carboxyl transferase, partial [Mycolicibacterium insubricum]|nr:acetyl-CoA carboxyl transferase [Mycolicibacterium insubricum]
PGIRSADLLRNGIVDVVVGEYPDAADEPEEFLRRLGDAIATELAGLRTVDPADRMAARFQRYRRIGL